MLIAPKYKPLIFLSLLLLVWGAVAIFAPGSNSAKKAQFIAFTAAGSTSVQPIVEMLAQEYMAAHRNIRINVQGGGSSSGVKAAQTGTAELGMASRELKESEKGLWEFILAYDGIAVVVHPTNTVSDLSLEQIEKIFSGEISNWSQVGGPDAAINVINREAGSGTRSAFEEIVLNGKNFVEDAIIQGSTGSVKTSVAMDPNAIGYVSLASLDDLVKTLLIDQVAATNDNISNKTYPIARPFILMAKAKPTGAVAEFLAWLESDEATQILIEEGLVPVK